MKANRELMVKEYISELLQEGKIDYGPCHFKNLRILDPIYVIEKNKDFFVAQQITYNASLDESGEIVCGPFGQSNFRLVYFPTNLDHAELLSRSKVRVGGPQETLPGSAAVLYVDYSKDGGVVSLIALQYCFKQGSPPGLNRSLASKYMGANYHLLRSFFDMDLVSKLNCVYVTSTLCSKPRNKKTIEEIVNKNKDLSTAFSGKSMNISVKGRKLNFF